MSMAPYTVEDIMQLLGQCTVELAWLRRRVAELEAQLAAESSPNGQVIEEVPRRAHAE